MNHIGIWGSDKSEHQGLEFPVKWQTDITQSYFSARSWANSTQWQSSGLSAESDPYKEKASKRPKWNESPLRMSKSQTDPSLWYLWRSQFPWGSSNQIPSTLSLNSSYPALPGWFGSQSPHPQVSLTLSKGQLHEWVLWQPHYLESYICWWLDDCYVIKEFF